MAIVNTIATRGHRDSYRVTDTQTGQTITHILRLFPRGRRPFLLIAPNYIMVDWCQFVYGLIVIPNTASKWLFAALNWIGHGNTRTAVRIRYRGN